MQQGMGWRCSRVAACGTGTVHLVWSISTTRCSSTRVVSHRSEAGVQAKDGDRRRSGLKVPVMRRWRIAWGDVERPPLPRLAWRGGAHDDLIGPWSVAERKAG